MYLITSLIMLTAKSVVGIWPKKYIVPVYTDERLVVLVWIYLMFTNNEKMDTFKKKKKNNHYSQNKMIQETIFLKSLSTMLLNINNRKDTPIQKNLFMEEKCTYCTCIYNCNF